MCGLSGGHRIGRARLAGHLCVTRVPPFLWQRRNQPCDVSLSSSWCSQRRVYTELVPGIAPLCKMMTRSLWLTCGAACIPRPGGCPAPSSCRWLCLSRARAIVSSVLRFSQGNQKRGSDNPCGCQGIAAVFRPLLMTTQQHPTPQSSSYPPSPALLYRGTSGLGEMACRIPASTWSRPGGPPGAEGQPLSTLRHANPGILDVHQVPLCRSMSNVME